MSSFAVMNYFFRTRKLQLFLIWITIVISTASFYIMNGFIDSLKERLYHSARNISSGDIKIQAFQEMKPASLQEIDKIIENHYQTMNMLIFPNMIRKEGGNSFLVSVKAVEETYPFFGSIKLRDQVYEPLKPDEAYLAKEAADRFAIKIGDKLILGSQSILVKGVIEELPDQGFSGGAAFNPTLLIRIENARASGLLQFGSRVSYLKLYKGKGISQEKIEKDAEAIEAQLSSESLQISTWKDSQNMSRSLFDRLGSYFNILSYTAVILSSIGFYLGLSAFVMKISKDGSILYGFGVSKARLQKEICMLLISLVVFGCLIGLLFGLGGESYLIHQMDEMVVSIKSTSIHWPLIIFTFLFCLLSSATIINISIKKYLKELNPLNHNLSFTQNNFSVSGFFFYILLIFVLLALFSWYQTGVLKTSFGLNGMIIILLLLLFGFIGTILFLLQIIFKPLANLPSIYIASIEFFRNKLQYLPGLVGLVFSSVLVLGIISARDSIKQKLTISDQNDLANVFMIDIQKSQLPDVQKMIDDSDHYRNFNFSPLVRARLTHINGTNIDELKTKAKEKDDTRKLSFLSRSYNLTYKDQLNKSEKIIDGAFWGEGYDGPGISLEVDFAKSMNMKMGDSIGFDLAGLPLDGKVTSLRTIDWSSMMPNFFVIFPTKKLEAAPQFIIGSARIDEKQISVFQNQLVAQFPNISVLELSTIFKKVQNLFEKVLKVLVVSSGLCVMASLAIMISTLVVNEEDVARRSHLLKSTGMNARKILIVSIFEKLFYFLTLILAVFFIHLIWNQLVSNWMNEPIPFNPILFGIYSFIMLILIFCPLVFNRLTKNLQPTIDN